MASTLPPEIVEEILLRVRPDEPAHLVHAALVCKAWRHILSDDGFRHRYRRFHRSPPLLGYIHNLYHRSMPQLLPISTAAFPVSMPALKCSWALDCRHGRVLILTKDSTPTQLLVWDTITGGQQYLNEAPYSYSSHTAAVLCVTDGCDHLDCHGGPFQVVFVGTNRVGLNMLIISVTVYSSETGAWSASTSIDTDFSIYCQPILHIGDALCFAAFRGGIMISILKYDLCRHELSMIDMPGESSVIFTPGEYNMAMSLIKLEDGGLGIVALLDNCIYMWSRPDSIGEWVKHKVMELGTLLPQQPFSRKVISFAEGTYTIFISMLAGIFALDLKSRQVRKVGEKESYHPILPYMSFYNPRFA